VAVIGRERGQVRATGCEYEMAWMHLFTFRGPIRRIHGFCDSHELMQAAQAEASR
jgi:ketosteroid isomerase-like protein